MKTEGYVILIMRPPREDEITEFPGWILDGWGTIVATSFKVAKDLVSKSFGEPQNWAEIESPARCGIRATLADGRILQVMRGPLYLPEVEGHQMKLIDRKGILQS